MSEFKYVGSELDLFAAVVNWKRYWAGAVQPYIQGDVLEVGAGIGSNTPFLNHASQGRWVCLEPDPELTAKLTANVQKLKRQPPYEVITGDLSNVTGVPFDTIVYIDVLEHIEDDRAELNRAITALRPGGRVIVLSPAHQSLFTPFDEAVGHFRRYDRRMMKALAPTGAKLEKLMYLDSLGLALSLGNRLFLKQSMPTSQQLQVWDKFVVPVSRILDPCLAHSLGKTIVGVWRRDGGA